MYFFEKLLIASRKLNSATQIFSWLILIVNTRTEKYQKLASNLSISIRDASADMEDEEPKSDVLRVLTSA